MFDEKTGSAVKTTELCNSGQVQSAPAEKITPPFRTAPRIKVKNYGDGSRLSFDHADHKYAELLLMKAIGTTNLDFLHGILNQLKQAASITKGVDEKRLNFMLSVIEGIKPKDQIEALLASQMAAIHCLTMTFARRLAIAEDFMHQDSAERTLNKLARTFSGQIEALKRYRSSGEQKVTVEHVTVNQGGQAIVGNVAHGGPGTSEKTSTTP